MSKVTLITRSGSREIEVFNSETTLMAELLKHQIPVASSCGGEGVCAKCQIQVLAGAENLSPMTDIEQLAKDRFGWKSYHRMSCQCQVHGDCTVTTPYW
jgi:ferredoxin, 2Fe-2S